jgi:hypothetical protein
LKTFQFFSERTEEKNVARNFEAIFSIGCGNNGQDDQVDSLYSIRVKSTLTGHKREHLHLYQINGRIRLGKVEPIRVKTEISAILCETDNWRENRADKQTAEYMIK